MKVRKIFQWRKWQPNCMSSCVYLSAVTVLFDEYRVATLTWKFLNFFPFFKVLKSPRTLIWCSEVLEFSKRGAWNCLSSRIVNDPCYKDTLLPVSYSCHLASIHQRTLILFIQTLALYKSFTYLLTYLLTYMKSDAVIGKLSNMVNFSITYCRQGCVTVLKTAME